MTKVDFQEGFKGMFYSKQFFKQISALNCGMYGMYGMWKTVDFSIKVQGKNKVILLPQK